MRRIKIDTRDVEVESILVAFLPPLVLVGLSIWTTLKDVPKTGLVFLIAALTIFTLSLVIWPLRSGSTFRDLEDKKIGAKTFLVFRIEKG